MFVRSHLPGTVAAGRAPLSSSEVAPRSFAAAFRINLALVGRYFWQSFGLAWITAAILVYPVIQAGREREARELVRRLGGRCHLDDCGLARLLPQRISDWVGLDNLHAIRTINFSHCDVSDADVDKLLCLRSLQQVNLCGCSRVTTAAVSRLQMLPQMKLVWIDGMSVEDASRCLMGEEQPRGVFTQLASVLER